MTTVSSSPGKLILAGEHTVLCGAQAIAVAIQEYTSITLLNCSETKLSIPPLGITKTPLNQLVTPHLATIKHAISSLIDMTPGQVNLDITIDTSIPMGAGMGSSASVFSALTKAWQHHFMLEFDIIPIVQHFEQIAHHQASQVDAHTVIHGGAWTFPPAQQANPIHCELTGWYWLNTGRPQSSTAECVKHTLPLLKAHPEWTQLSDKAAQDLCQGLQDNTPDLIHESLQTLHQNLVRLGVVPTSIQAQIESLRSQGISAKISGAGTLVGDQAGILLLYSPNVKPDLDGVKPLVLSKKGVHLC